MLCLLQDFWDQDCIPEQWKRVVAPHLDSEKPAMLGNFRPADWSTGSLEKGLDEDDYIANPSSSQETLCTSYFNRTNSHFCRAKVLDNLRYSRSITRNLMKKVFTKTSR
jgi:hypothetical protein